MRRERSIDVNVRSGAQMLEYEAIADRIAREMSGRVLDWGCGHGQITQLLRERGVDADGFDYREGAPLSGEEQLEHYKSITIQVSGDEVRLPYEDGRFAAVLSCGVLEHVQSPDRSLDELHRVLAPGGRLYVYKLPNRLSYLEAIARITGLYYHGKLPYDRVYTPSSARSLLERHGFAVEQVRLTNLLPLTISAPSLQGASKAIWDANVALNRVRPLQTFATNIELDALAR